MEGQLGSQAESSRVDKQCGPLDLSGPEARCHGLA